MSSTHTVKQGESLPVIADMYGFPSYQVIYDDPGNEALRAKRPDPNVLYEGDEVFIPDHKLKTVELATGQSHTIVIQSEPRHLRLILTRSDGETLDGQAYELEIDGETIEGKTDGNGQLDEIISKKATSAKLRCAELEWEIDLDHLNPLDHVDDDDASSVEARLHNLGYPVELTGKWDQQLADAIMAFQADSSLPITGEFDDATAQALLAAHGS